MGGVLCVGDITITFSLLGLDQQKQAVLDNFDTLHNAKTWGIKFFVLL